MAFSTVSCLRLRDLLTVKNFYLYKFLHTSTQHLVKVAHWRIEHGLPPSGREYGPLIDLPDWSYADGRPAPLAQAQKRRILKNMEYCERIVKLTKEIDDAVALCRKSKEDEEQEFSHFIENRLKRKGDKGTQQHENSSGLE